MMRLILVMLSCRRRKSPSHRLAPLLSALLYVFPETVFAAGAADNFLRLGAARARDCLRLSAGDLYKGGQMHSYFNCLKSASIPIEYSSRDEKLVDVGLFMAASYIMKREFGELKKEDYGKLGRLEIEELDADTKWAISHLKNEGMDLRKTCAALEWVECKIIE